MKKKKGISSTVILVLVMLIGLSLLLYPSFSDYVNSLFQSHAVSDYIKEVAVLDNDKYEEFWHAAIAYNESLTTRENIYALDDARMEQYNQLLDVTATGIMGYVEIPSIDVMLPIYHGTNDSVLQDAVGHLEWTSLPTGGESTHCVISGHRGLPSARLFTDLDELMVGDLFVLYVLDEVLTYEVDQIRIVEPHETEELLIQEGRDLCTLVTCTPYAINTHRLMVRGHRVENLEEVQTVRVTADALIVEKMVVVPFVLAPILLLMVLLLLITTRKKKK